jgi:hypothetical protein
MHEYEEDRWRIIAGKVGNGFSASACKEKASDLDSPETPAPTVTSPDAIRPAVVRHDPGGTTQQSSLEVMTQTNIDTEARNYGVGTTEGS